MTFRYPATNLAHRERLAGRPAHRGKLSNSELWRSATTSDDVHVMADICSLTVGRLSRAGRSQSSGMPRDHSAAGPPVRTPTSSSVGAIRGGVSARGGAGRNDVFRRSTADPPRSRESRFEGLSRDARFS